MVKPEIRSLNGCMIKDETARAQVAQLSEEIEKFPEFVTPEMYRAAGDGVTDDTAAIQEAINTNKKVVFATGKTYCITDALLVSGQTIIDLNWATVKVIASCDSVFTYDGGNVNHGRVLKNGKIDGNNLANYGINVVSGSRDLYDNLEIMNCGTGFYHSETHETGVINCHFASCAVAIHSVGTDTNFENINIRHCKTAIKAYGEYCNYINIHAWMKEDITDSVFAEVNAEGIVFGNCYVDTYMIGYKILRLVKTHISGRYFINASVWNANNGGEVSYVVYSDSRKYLRKIFINDMNIQGIANVTNLCNLDDAIPNLFNTVISGTTANSNGFMEWITNYLAEGYKTPNNDGKIFRLNDECHMDFVISIPTVNSGEIGTIVTFESYSDVIPKFNQIIMCALYEKNTPNAFDVIPVYFNSDGTITITGNDLTVVGKYIRLAGKYTAQNLH